MPAFAVGVDEQDESEDYRDEDDAKDATTGACPDGDIVVLVSELKAAGVGGIESGVGGIESSVGVGRDCGRS